MDTSEPSGVDLVTSFLKGQNLEQIGRVDEAVRLYEGAVAARFDSPGPYDRLIHIYSDRAEHGEVVRVSTAALENVRTHQAKLEWYEQMRQAAKRAASDVPPAAPKRNT
jgi:hypothetical protein